MGFTRFRVIRAAKIARAVVAGEVADEESTGAAAATVEICVAEAVAEAGCLLDLAETKTRLNVLPWRKRKKKAFHFTKSLVAITASGNLYIMSGGV